LKAKRITEKKCQSESDLRGGSDVVIDEETINTLAVVDIAIAALTLDDVNACLRKYVKPEDFAFVYAGTFTK